MSNKAQPIKAVGYIRVSTDQQASDGVSLAAQRAKIEQYCELYDLELVRIIEDAGQSAKTLERAGLHQALDCLNTGEASALIVAKLDRLTRSVADLATLLEQYFASRFDLVSVGEQVNTGTAAGRLVLNVLMSVSQWEREAISERTRTALQYKKSQGKRVGSIPYGFDLGADGAALEENAEEQEIIRAVVKFHAAGLSLGKIAAQLGAHGYNSRGGGKWHPQTIKNILAARMAA
jgi:DNA invertase Pin-like site-specific DNA recombinase